MKKSPIESDLKALISITSSPRIRSNAFAYVFVFVFITCTAFIAFSPSNDLFASSSSSLASLLSHFLPDSAGTPLPEDKGGILGSGKVGNGDGADKGGILGSRNRSGGTKIHVIFLESLIGIEKFGETTTCIVCYTMEKIHVGMP